MLPELSWKSWTSILTVLQTVSSNRGDTRERYDKSTAIWTQIGWFGVSSPTVERYPYKVDWQDLNLQEPEPQSGAYTISPQST